MERIVRASRVPVFVASRAFKPINKMLVAFDGSASARRAIGRMAQSPVFEGLEITVLHAQNAHGPIGARMDEAVAGLTAVPRVVRGEPDEVLGSTVASDGFDLLVMGAYGHSRIRSLIIGSTTTAMVQAATIPVLLYR